MTWSRPFETPIDSGNGKTFITLRDAGTYITSLPKKVSAQAHWQTAMRCLIDAAERGGIRLLAEIAVRQALVKTGKPARTLT